MKILLLQVLKDSWFFFKLNFVKILSILLPVLCVQYTLLAILGQLPLSEGISANLDSIQFLLSLIFHSIYTAGLIYLFNSILGGHFISTKDCLLKGLTAAPLLLMTDCASFLITLAGFFFFIIPGVILAARLSLTSYYLLLEGKRPFEAIRQSYDSTKGYTLTILGCLLLVGVTFVGLFTIFPALAGEKAGVTIPPLVVGVFSDLFSSFLAVILFRFYCLIREAEARE